MKLDIHMPLERIQLIGVDGRVMEVLDRIEEKAKENNGYVRIIVSNVAKPRSTGENSQNHHLNGHIQFICQETGNEFSHVKEYVKGMAIPMGYPMKVNAKGDTVLDMFGNPVGISESESTVHECGLLISAVHMLAGELGINLPED